MSTTRIWCLVVLLLALAACATRPPGGFGIEPDATVGEAVAATARAVASRDVAVVVHVGHAVRAELRPDRTIHVWRGLLLRTPDASELAFALAHELAHDALGHSFPARGAERNLDQELAADAEARARLATTGFDPAGGFDLLHALRGEAALMGADASALAELDRRIAAFPVSEVSFSVRADDPWRATWQARWREWLADDPASGDRRRLELLERRAAAAGGAY
jgi:hypothetical protein